MGEAGWARLGDRELAVLAHTLADVARDLGSRSPPPRGLPFHGLDHAAGELEPYTQLAAHGIFRKYESVLMLGAGLGGAARWCHARFGCDVTGVERAAAVCAAAQHLSARSGLAGHTRFVAARPSALPVRGREFTHVWGIEGFLDVRRGDARLAEIFRAVRLGGVVALQQSGAPPDWAERAAVALASVGLVEARAEVVERPPLRDAVVRARQLLLEALRRGGEAGARAAEGVERVHARWPDRGGPVSQIFARRPS